MPAFIRILALAALLLGVAIRAFAQKYELIARWDVERLNRILQTDMPKFAGIPVSPTPARNAVRLERRQCRARSDKIGHTARATR